MVETRTDNIFTSYFALAWPWMGLIAAGILLGLLFGTNLFHKPGTSRWRDIGWLAWLGIPLYMLHQFEEHGVDARGYDYAFHSFMCQALGYRSGYACPVPLSFITAVNVGGVWGATLLSALAGRKRPIIALSSYGIPLVNLVAHIGPAILRRGYNPGLLTSVFLFLPVCAWVVHVVRQMPSLGPRRVPALVLGGLACHVVLMGSLLLSIKKHLFGEHVLAAIQVCNFAVPALVASAIAKSKSAPVS